MRLFRPLNKPMKIGQIFMKNQIPQSFFALLLFLLLVVNSSLFSQGTSPLFVKDTKAANREKLYNNMVNNGIIRNLSSILSDSTEENWMDAFYNMEFIRYKAPWVQSKVANALQDIEKRSVPFQRSMLELLFTNYPNAYPQPVLNLLNSTANDKIFAMCAAYLLVAKPTLQPELWNKTLQYLTKDTGSAIIRELMFTLGNFGNQPSTPLLNDLLKQPFFSKAVVMFSFQRKNRNYPGLVIVRDSAGNFLKDENGKLFSVPQLARSINNLPGYLTYGNTPQGIFRMDGMAVSNSVFIGPTPNFQLTMPYETSLQHFMNDSSITDTVWTADWYKKLLPESWQQYFPIMQTFHAGKAGRTEIIAHGTTINPAYYIGQPYYPLTPSLGCLCTKELWSEVDGSRLESDQQKLVAALQKAGGANGYCIVIELDDAQKPVLLEEIIISYKL